MCTNCLVSIAFGPTFFTAEVSNFCGDFGNVVDLAEIWKYTVSKKGYHPTTNDNFNNSCPIPVIFGTTIAD